MARKKTHSGRTIFLTILIILLILGAIFLGIYLGTSVYQGGFNANPSSLAFSVSRTDLCRSDITPWLEQNDIISCNAYKHFFAEGYKCVCLLK